MKITYDSNIFIGRKPVFFPRAFHLSSIVVAELQGGAQDRGDLKRLETLRKSAINLEQFLVPDAEDWWEAGKVLQRLSQTSKRENFGSTPKLSPAERVRLFNDVLLAVSCRRNNIMLVTDNLKDFERVQSACRVKIQSGDEHFFDE